MKGFEGFTDADFRRTILSAIRLLSIIAAAASVLVWLKLGWQSAALLLVGALISGSGLWEWLRLMTALIAQMDSEPESTGKVKPIGPVLFAFFLRLAVAVGLLYGSLKLLHGSVFALAAGLGLGVFCLSIEGIRLMKAWTV